VGCSGATPEKKTPDSKTELALVVAQSFQASVLIERAGPKTAFGFLFECRKPPVTITAGIESRIL
jgi:hypothetical protein